MAMVELTESSSSSIHIASSSHLPPPHLLSLSSMALLLSLSLLLSSSRPIKAKDLERPLVSDDSDHNTGFARIYNVEGASHQIEWHFNSSWNQGLAYKHRLPHMATKLPHTHSDSLILDIPEDTSVGQTLKRPSVTNLSGDVQKVKEDSCHDSGFGLEDKANEFVPEYSVVQRSILMLEVVSGPSRGLRYSTQSTNKSGLPIQMFG